MEPVFWQLLLLPCSRVADPLAVLIGSPLASLRSNRYLNSMHSRHSPSILSLLRAAP